MARKSLRDQLVRSGATTIHERGFNGAGVREITSAAEVPQGSFTNHFGSKEEFGVAVLNHYFGEFGAVIAQTLGDTTRSPLERVRFYFSTLTERFEEMEYRHGCLTGNMALEASEHSELIRTRLMAIFAEHSGYFAAVLRDAQAAGQLSSDCDTDSLGAAVLEGWQGAMLRMKVERTRAPLDRFQGMTLPALLALWATEPALALAPQAAHQPGARSATQAMSKSNPASPLKAAAKKAARSSPKQAKK